jgi:hypothetical protein
VRYTLFLPAIAFAGAVPAQGLTLATEVLDPLQNFVSSRTVTGSQTLYLPAGPVAFPVHLATPTLSFPYASLDLIETISGSTTTLSIIEYMNGGNSRYGVVECLLRTTVTALLPARVSLAIDPVVTWAGFNIPSHDAAVDIGADGSPEYSYTYAFPAPPSPGTLAVLVDSRGTPLDVQSRSYTGGGGGGNLTTHVDLQFTAPVHDLSYGSPCGAEFGSQLDAANPFARTFVASLPGNTILAWFAGGDQQASITVPGFSCPLLTNNVVVISVPLVPGPNGRSMAVLDLLLPPIPGATWYAQGVGFAGGTFVGTNGAIIRT